MRIERITLNEIGPFPNTEIEFEKGQANGKAEVHIFTGNNGSGKTTILQGLVASLMNVNGGFRNGIDKRFREQNGQSSLKVELENEIKVSFSFNQYKLIKDINKSSKNGFSLNQYETFQSNDRLHSHPKDFAAFAYSSYRNLGVKKIDVISEMAINPLKEALLFSKATGNNYLNQWLANIIAKSALAYKNKDHVKSKAYENSLHLFQKAISDLIGKKVEFVLEDNPLNIVLKLYGKTVDFDVLPDGLKSMISWLGDLLMRMDLMKWDNNTPIFERNFILFLDEIEVHLHPKWQRKILPIICDLFPNAQIFLTTHSPFVVNSVDNAWVYKLKLDEQGNSSVEEKSQSKTGQSYAYVLDEIFDIEERFDENTEEELDKFYEQKTQILKGETVDENAFLQLAKQLVQKGVEVSDIINFELRQLNKLAKTNFQL